MVMATPDRVTRGSGGNGASTSGAAKNASGGSSPEARHLRGLKLADHRNKPLAAGAAASGDLVAAAYPAEADRRWWGAKKSEPVRGKICANLRNAAESSAASARRCLPRYHSCASQAPQRK